MTLCFCTSSFAAGICYIAAKNDPIATKRKATLIELKASNVTIGFDLGHDLDLEFSRLNMEFTMLQPKMVRLPRNEKQTYRLNSMPQIWPWPLTTHMALTMNSCYLRMGGLTDIEQRGWKKVIHDHDCDHMVTKVRCKDLPYSDRGDFRCQHAVDSSSLY